MIEKLKDDRFVKKILLVFLAIQPFLDCWLLYTDEVIGFFGFSPTTIIRTLIIAVLVLIVFFNKDNKKTRRFIYIYILVILLYTVIHNFLVFNLDNSGYKVFNYNLIVEMFYILRMMLPLCIIYITYCLKPKKEEIIQLFLIVGMCISIIIVASNLIVFSLASYGGGVIKGNVFDWFFSTKYTAGDLASKGWFNSANQISGLMYIVLPVCIYSLLEQVNKYRIAINILIVISMIMLGTRVATYGWLLLFIIMTIIYLFYSFVTKNQRFEKNRIYSILGILVVGLILMSHAPLGNTVTNYTDEDDDEMKRLRSENVSTKQLLKYIRLSQDHTSCSLYG